MLDRGGSSAGDMSAVCTADLGLSGEEEGSGHAGALEGDEDEVSREGDGSGSFVSNVAAEGD